MSRYSQGVLARKLVNSPCKPLLSLPLLTAFSAVFCRTSVPAARGSRITILKPPAVPKPSIGGAPKTWTWASGISSSNSSCKRSAMASADRSACLRKKCRSLASSAATSSSVSRPAEGEPALSARSFSRNFFFFSRSRSGARRSWKSSSIRYIEPKLGAFTFKSRDWPLTATRFLTPSVRPQWPRFAARLSRCAAPRRRRAVAG